MRIAATPSASLALMREARCVFAGIGFAIATMLLLVLGGALRTVSPVVAVMLFQVTRSPRAPTCRPPASQPRRDEADNSDSGGITCLIAVRTIGPAPLGTAERWMLAAIARAAIMLDGADCWAARRQGLASAFGARFHMIAVAKAATVPFRIPAIGAIPLSLPRGSVDTPALRGRYRLATRRRERSPHSEHRAALRPRPATPQAALRGVERWHSACSPFHVPPTSSFCCRSRRIGSGADEFGSANRGARYLGSPVMMLGDK
jgi:hypothetical protein